MVKYMTRTTTLTVHEDYAEFLEDAFSHISESTLELATSRRSV